MHVEIQEISPCVKKLDVEIPLETVKDELDKAYRQLGRTVKVDGFRQGKIPRSILEGLYRSAVEKEVIQKLIPESCEEILKDKGIEAAGVPVVGGEVKLVKDQPFKFSVTIEVIPSIVLKPYEGLQFIKKVVNITEEKVERALKNIQESSAEYEAKPEALAEKGDLIVVDWQAESLERAAIVNSQENFAMIIGSSLFGQEVENSLISARVGEQRTVSTLFPSDYKEREWAGKRINFNFTLKELKKKKLPQIDTEFAKGLGYNDLNDLRLDLKKQLETLEELTANNELGKLVVSKLIQDNPIETPPVMVENRIQQMILELQHRLKIQGAGETPLNIDKLKDNYKTVAEERVKGELILRKIAEAEKIIVSEEDINKELEAVASRKKMSTKSLKDSMMKNGSLDALKMNILLENALAVVIAKSQVETLRGSREKLFPNETTGSSGSEAPENLEKGGSV